MLPCTKMLFDHPHGHLNRRNLLITAHCLTKLLHKLHRTGGYNFVAHALLCNALLYRGKNKVLHWLPALNTYRRGT